MVKKFTDGEILEIKGYFDALDDDSSGSIGADELEIPLISLGIAKDRLEVEEIIKNIDEDCDILFEEFLEILSME